MFPITEKVLFVINTTLQRPYRAIELSSIMNCDERTITRIFKRIYNYQNELTMFEIFYDDVPEHDGLKGCYSKVFIMRVKNV